MSTSDIGESLVGAYLRHVLGCDVVIYNSFFADRQGEVDVVALEKGQPRTVWLCEVTTHIGGMQLTDSHAKSVQVILNKLDRLQHFAETTFPGDIHRYEWWSPRVPVGRMTAFMETVEQEWAAQGRELRFVMNGEYTERMRALVASAARNSSATNEPAYRMLQVLARLRGGAFRV